MSTRDATIRFCLWQVLLLAACTTAPLSPTPKGGKPLAELEAGIEQALKLRAERRQDEGIALLDQVRTDALAAGEAKVATRALNRRGDLLHDLSRDAEAREAYLGAVNEAEARQDFSAVGRAAHDLALLGEETECWYLKALEARRKAGDRPGIRTTANNLGSLYFFAGRDEESRAMYLEAMAAAQADGDHASVCREQANLALLVFDPRKPRDERREVEVARPLPRLDVERLRTARGHYAEAVAACARANQPEAKVQGYLACDEGDPRCELLTPRASLEAALLDFWGRVAERTKEELERELAGRGTFDDLEALVAAHAVHALACLRTWEAASAAGPALAEKAGSWERQARESFAKAMTLADQAKIGRADLCALDQLEDLCRRLGP